VPSEGDLVKLAVEIGDVSAAGEIVNGGRGLIDGDERA
jgi:hypothetical protein